MRSWYLGVPSGNDVGAADAASEVDNGKGGGEGGIGGQRRGEGAGRRGRWDGMSAVGAASRGREERECFCLVAE